MAFTLMKAPREVDIDITCRCNLRCSYCSHFSGPGDVNKDLPAAEWLKFFEELGRNNVMKVILQGGEPLFRKDLKEILTGIVRNRMRFIILTNGTLIDDDIASFIASTGRCDLVQVSIDGDDASTHDVFRGNGTFRKAIRGIRELQLYRVPVSVRVTIHRQNVGRLDRIARLLLEDMGLRSFTTNSASYLGRCRDDDGSIQLTVEERSKAMEALLTLNERYGGRIGGTAGPVSEARMWIEMESARKEGKPPMPGRGTLSGCGCSFQKLAVRSDGVYIPCVQMSHIEMGRINVDRLEDVWHHSPGLNGLRERNIIPLDRLEPCKDCEYSGYCTGNCPAVSYLRYGDINMPNMDVCLKKFLSDGGRLPAVSLRGT